MEQLNKYYPNISDKYFIDESGKLYTDYGKKQMSDNARQNGYIVNSFYGPNGYRVDLKRHVIMAEVFLPPKKEEQTQINHINGIKTDNRAENLEWCTGQYNIRHAWNNGLAQPKRGSSSNFAILNEEQVLEIAKLLEEGVLAGKQIAKKYNVSNRTISAIKCRHNWYELTKDFNF